MLHICNIRIRFVVGKESRSGSQLFWRCLWFSSVPAGRCWDSSLGHGRFLIIQLTALLPVFTKRLYVNQEQSRCFLSVGSAQLSPITCHVQEPVTACSSGASTRILTRFIAASQWVGSLVFEMSDLNCRRNKIIVWLVIFFSSLKGLFSYACLNFFSFTKHGNVYCSLK